MKNPWTALPDAPPFILPDEQEAVLSFNQTSKEIHQIRHELLPEPYLGNPEAEIILLNLNPGFSEQDANFYAQLQVRSAWRKNLLHEEMDYSFYMFDFAISQDTGGPKWWSKRLKEPIQIAGRKVVAQKFCCIEYFPYHPRRYGGFKTTLPSQKYNFYLVQKAVERNAVIISMRKTKSWVFAVPELKNHKLFYQVSSVQNPAISRRNCPEGFSLIEEILRQ